MVTMISFDNISNREEYENYRFASQQKKIDQVQPAVAALRKQIEQLLPKDKKSTWASHSIQLKQLTNELQQKIELTNFCRRDWLQAQMEEFAKQNPNEGEFKKISYVTMDRKKRKHFVLLQDQREMQAVQIDGSAKCLGGGTFLLTRKAKTYSKRSEYICRDSAKFVYQHPTNEALLNNTTINLEREIFLHHKIKEQDLSPIGIGALRIKIDENTIICRHYEKTLGSLGLLDNRELQQAVFQDLLRGLMTLHQVNGPGNVYHGDIKEDNVMVNLSSKQAFLIDLADIGIEGKIATACSPAYVSLSDCQNFETIDKTKLDVFALGLVFLKALIGIVRMKNCIERDACSANVVTGINLPPNWGCQMVNAIPKSLQQLIESMLILEADKRPSAQECWDAFQQIQW